MAERPEDLNLPITVVQRIIKESLPDGVIVSKEARQSICRASSVFVLYLTSCAVSHANKAKRKTLAVNDIISAITEMEFDSFVQPLNDVLQFRKNNLSAQNAKSKTAGGKKDMAKVDEEGEDEEMEEEEEQVEETKGNEDDEDEEENKDEESGRKKKKRKTGDENNEDAEKEDEENEENELDDSESDESDKEDERID